MPAHLRKNSFGKNVLPGNQTLALALKLWTSAAKVSQP